MAFFSRGPRLIWLSTGMIAAGTLLLAPLAAQQMAPKLLPAPFPQPQSDDQESIAREVLLGPDGSLTAAVFTADRAPVPGARLMFTPATRMPASSQVWKTSANGVVVILGIKPGIYHLAIVAAQGSYKGLVSIRPADPVDKSHQHLIAFTLECACSSEVLEDSTCAPTGSARLLTGRLADPLLVGAAATAAALSLTLGGEEEGPVIPVVSP
jgi:hypothetical protein